MRFRGDGCEPSRAGERFRTIASLAILPPSPTGAGRRPTEAPSVTGGSSGVAADPRPGRTALVVDDDPACRSVIGSMLGIAGWTTVEVGSVREAISRLAEGRCDLMVTDLRLPDASGVALIEAVRSDPSLRGFPVVVCSGADRFSELRRAREAGCSAVVSKPFSLDELIEAVDQSIVDCEPDT